MASKNTNPAINGAGRRRCQSWIESFIQYTDNIESPPIYRKWVAIGAIAATLEQKVWLTTSSPLYPNLYVFLVGHPGLGKTRAITSAANFLRELPDPHISPTSMTMASLVDHLEESKRTIIEMPNPPIEYNSLLIIADELSAFMHEYTQELIAGLTQFYDVVEYGQGRRVRDIRITIKRPQLSIMVGTTPSNLVRFIPDYAWDEGFTSRIMLIFADDKPLIDVFDTPAVDMPDEMLHDINVINRLSGPCHWTLEWKRAMNDWKSLGHPPVPTHPKLKYYNERRFAHMIKLSIIACVDRGNELVLNDDDFNRAMGWMLEAEHYMPLSFQLGSMGYDSKVMDEVEHYIKSHKEGLAETEMVNFIRSRVPAYAITNVIGVMEKAGLIRAVSIDKLGLRTFKTLK